jgi:Tol biopolymer transport system component
VRVNEGEEAHGPQMLPDGDHVLFTLATGTSADRWDRARIVVQSLSTGQRTTIVSGGTDARYVPPGLLVYGRSDTVFGSGTLFGVAFDASRMTAGAAAPLVDAVRTSNSRVTGALQFDVSASGTLVYVPGSRVGPEFGKQQLVLADRVGKTETLPVPPNSYRAVRVSPDGLRIALEVASGNESDIYVYDIGHSSPLRPVTFDGKNRYPVWSADGRRIAFQSDREGDAAIFIQPADGSGAASRLTRPGAGESHAPECWSADGRTLLFSVATSSHVSLATLSVKNARVTAFGKARSAIPVNARLSPDGRWVAYNESDRTGKSMIFVEPFPATDARYQLVVQGPASVPHKPVWSHRGELIYVPRLGALEAVSLVMRPAFAFGTAVPLPRQFNPGAPAVRALYDILPDDRFVGVVPVGDSDAIYAAPEIQVVLNWLEELKRLVPAHR